MKVRTDFVTNSSSSSYIIVSKVNYCQELIDYMKEEYGKYGVRLLEKLTYTGAKIREDNVEDLLDYFKDFDALDQLVDDDKYLCARFIEWTNEGDTEDDDAWLHEHIPEEYLSEIFQTGG